MITVAAVCSSSTNWLDHLSVGGAIAVAAIALAASATVSIFFWSLFR
jgi:hypothetical protein